jgi:hypothetical protein
MEAGIKQHFEHIKSNDKEKQGASFHYLMDLTEEPVDWLYEIYDGLLSLLKNGDNRGRAIAAQLLCNLAKSDREGRLTNDFEQLIEVTKDEKFVTARHSLLSLWKIGILNKTMQAKVMEGLSRRFKECITEKNCTLIRYDIAGVFKKMYDLQPSCSLQTAMNISL